MQGRAAVRCFRIVPWLLWGGCLGGIGRLLWSQEEAEMDPEREKQEAGEAWI